MNLLRASGAHAFRATARSRSWRYGFAASCIVVALVVREVLLPDAADKSPFQTFVIAVLASAFVGGLGPGLFATALGALLAVTMYLPPFGQPTMNEPTDVVRLGLFVVEGTLASALGEGIRRTLAGENRLAEEARRVRRLLHVRGAAGLASPDEPLVEPLTEREIEVMRLLALGLRNSEIAATLYVSNNTVKSHLAHAYGKLGVRTRTEAVARCASLGLLEPPTFPAESEGPVADPDAPTSQREVRLGR